MRRLILLLALVTAIAAPARAQSPHHFLVIHIDSGEAEMMIEALHNATSTIDTIQQRGGAIAVEIVANGRGTAMFIASLSPVRDEIVRIHAKYPNIVMSACGISFAHTEQALKEKLVLVPEARMVPSGAVRIMELQERRWSYLKP